jgi:N-acetylmuramoyl-L-alanine amidase
MAIIYEVKQGDCLSSIADEHGFFWQTLWDHPNNANLKQKRKDPNTLLPGDRVHIPDKRPKEERRPTNQMHKFRLFGVPTKLRLRILLDNKPRANEPFTLEVDGVITRGTTSSSGKIEISIPPRAQFGKLIVGDGERATTYNLKLGRLNPHDEISGVQGRLNNLGYINSSISGTPTAETKRAIAAFQSDVRLAVTGDLDSATLAKLKEMDEGS